MLVVTHVHLYGQNRLHVNLRDLNKISDVNLTSPQMTVGQRGDNVDTFCPQTSLVETKASMVQGKGASTGM